MIKIQQPEKEGPKRRAAHQKGNCSQTSGRSLKKMGIGFCWGPTRRGLLFSIVKKGEEPSPGSKGDVPQRHRNGSLKTGMGSAAIWS